MFWFIYVIGFYTPQLDLYYVLEMNNGKKYIQHTLFVQSLFLVFTPHMM